MTKLEKLIEELCPDGVEYVPLSMISEKITDGMHNLPKKTLNEGEYPILSAQNVNNGHIDFITSKYVDQEIFDVENKRTNVEQGDILLTIVGAIGRIAVVEIPLKALFQRSICVIKPNHRIVNSKYLGYSLESTSVQSYIQCNAHGAAQKGIYLADVNKISIPLPPLPIQEEIVRILDNFTKLTAELEAELEARKKQYEFYRDSLLKFDIGRGSSDCFWKPLHEISEISTGSHNTNEELEEGDFKFFVRSQEVRRLNSFDYDETAIITSGDGVGVGKIFHYVEGKYALHQRAYRIHITSSDIFPKFFYYYMKTTFLSYIEKTAFNSSVTSIRRPMLNNYPVPIPPLTEQERIVNILDRFDKLCNDITEGLPAEIEARRKQYEYYRDKLLTFKALS